MDLICTIGPASAKPVVLRELMTHGMSIARLNMSHGKHADHQEVIRHVRKLSQETGKPVKILGDLQGPKIRLGKIEGEQIRLEPGETFMLTTKEIIGNKQQAGVDYPGIVNDLKVGSRIFINDGEVKLDVKAIHDEILETEVSQGGMIGSHKGVNLPGTTVGLPALTAKDQEDIQFLLAEKADWIACSFIRQASHLDEVRQYCSSLGQKNPPLVAKIETEEGLRNFSAILRRTNGIMIARGDLGVELPYEWVPLIQKVLIHECRRAKTFVITATHMLQSMLEHPMATRAEVTDIFQAVLDGTDAVMLSAESAAGQFPVKSIETLKAVAEFAEQAADEQPFDLADLLALLNKAR
jgi:pyruvate kinase